MKLGWGGRIPAYIAAFLFVACSSVSGITGDSENSVSNGAAQVGYQYRDDVGMWKHLYSFSTAFLIPDAAPSSIMIPHHDIAIPQQNAFYKALGRKIQPSVVVVIGPDHFEGGTNTVSVPHNTIFTAPGGNVAVDEALIARLCNDTVLSADVSLNTTMWIKDHAIFSQVPFIKKYFPGAKIMPMLLKQCVGERKFAVFEALGKWLAQNLPPDALVVASVDCSHYQIPRMTNLHDCVTRDIIQNNENPLFIEVDSPETMICLRAYNTAHHSDTPVLIHRTSTYDFIPDENIMSTSHQYWAFYPSGNEMHIADFRKAVKATSQRAEYTDYAKTKNLTILIGGSGDIGAGIRDYWVWDRYATATDRAEQLLRNAAGNEARFLSGFDALIFDVPKGERYTQSKHGTHLIINSTSSEMLEQEIPLTPKVQNKVSILVVICSAQHPFHLERFKQKLFTEYAYDVVVARYNSGEADSVAYLHNDDGSLEAINLGICAADAAIPIQGTLLAINWYAGQRSVHRFDYAANDGIIPAMYQFDIDAIMPNP
jgi:Predicted dioxygenase